MRHDCLQCFECHVPEHSDVTGSPRTIAQFVASEKSTSGIFTIHRKRTSDGFFSFLLLHGLAMS